ncbi:MAG: ABC transporter ATP-binding protein [Longimicrobiales bacterium]
MSVRLAFEVAGLEFTYPGADRPALYRVNASIAHGSFYAMIGPNGSGKTTLLRMLLALLNPDAGSVKYEGRPVRTWPRREVAKRIGVVAQLEEMPFPLEVRELVAMGRYPHLGPWRPPGHDDEKAVESALQRCQVSELATRTVDRLSGGERQRARLARALAQQPATLVLDEPTASLDIAHEMSIFELLSDLARRDGHTVVVVTHNLNLAARYADTLLFLDRGHVVAEGAPARVLTRDAIEATYHWPVRVVPHPGPGPDRGAPQVTPLSSGSIGAGNQRTNGVGAEDTEATEVAEILHNRKERTDV